MQVRTTKSQVDTSLKLWPGFNIEILAVCKDFQIKFSNQMPKYCFARNCRTDSRSGISERVSNFRL